MRVRLADISQGMVLTADVRNRHGQVLLAAGTALDARQIRVLQTWGIASVQVASDGKGSGGRPKVPRSVIEQAAVTERKRFKHNDLGTSHIHAVYLLAVKRRALATSREAQS